MCDSVNLDKAMSLAPTPPGNDLLSSEEIGRLENVYPLDLYFCRDCSHIQLGHVVDPKILYQKNYTYVSSTSSQFVEHLKDYSKEMINMFQLEQNSLIVDIGSNDGTFLNFFSSLIIFCSSSLLFSAASYILCCSLVLSSPNFS